MPVKVILLWGLSKASAPANAPHLRPVGDAAMEHWTQDTYS